MPIRQQFFKRFPREEREEGQREQSEKHFCEHLAVMKRQRIYLSPSTFPIFQTKLCLAVAENQPSEAKTA
jgi:hypothetical protein